MHQYFTIVDEGDHYQFRSNGYNFTYEKTKIEFLKEIFAEWLEQTSTNGKGRS
jgi:hypothetical protein